MNSMDVIAIKYEEARAEFAKMFQSSNSLAEESERLAKYSQEVSGGEYWQGTDAQAYAEKLYEFGTKLSTQAAGLYELTQLLARQADENEQLEIQQAQDIANR